MRQRRLIKAGVFSDLVDGIDRIIAANVGGLATRSDVINEALDAYITEVMLDWDARPESRGGTSGTPSNGPRSELAPVTDNAATGALRAPRSRGELMPDGQGVVNPAPLFFHNRDYPSIWAALTIAELTHDRLLPFDKVLKETTDRAWRFADGLRQLDASELKPTVLFPTNREKRDAAEAAFRSFAVGTYTRDGGSIASAGPLFLWGVCQVRNDDGVIVVGITPSGFEFLQKMDGLDARMPHEASYTGAFFAYIRENAPYDLWGFETICRLTHKKPSRGQLLDGFGAAAQRKGFTWTAHQVANYVSGYVSRAREWGLLAPKQIAGRYELTALGDAMLAEFEVAA